MGRRNIVRGALLLALWPMLLSLGGCTPGATVVWVIWPASGVPAPVQDMGRLRRIVASLGYVQGDAAADPKMEGEFFYFEQAQRLNVALLPDKKGAIRLKLLEIGDKRLSILGRQQAARIADELVAEFGRERVSAVAGPADGGGF